VPYVQHDDDAGTILAGVRYDPGNVVFRARTRRRFQKRLEVADLEDSVVVRFINARDNDARASFLGRFGFLLNEEHQECWIKDLTSNQVYMRKMLASAGSDQPDTRTLNRLLTQQRHLAPVLDGRRVWFKATSLYGLMLWEIVMVVEKDARFTMCQHCDKAFLTGSTTGRRSHAAYCSDRCRVAAMRARNSER
jgi:hypothetical protein